MRFLIFLYIFIIVQWGEPGSQKRKDLLEVMKKKRQEDAKPLIAKIEEILKSYRGKVPQEYMDQMTEEYETFKNRIFM